MKRRSGCSEEIPSKIYKKICPTVKTSCSGHKYNRNICTYVFTPHKENTALDRFYQLILEAFAVTKKHEITLFVGDFKAKVVSKNSLNVTETRNERLERVLQFCQEQNFDYE